MAEGTDINTLMDTIAALSSRLAPVALDGMTLTRLGSFLALTPQGDVTALAQMASTVVRELDRFRAPPDAAEIARRKQANLTALQEKNLKDWGYPYVMDAFRFHMTLTGPLQGAQHDVILAQAIAHFADLPPRPFVVDSLTLVGESTEGFFHEIQRYTLTGK